MTNWASLLTFIRMKIHKKNGEEEDKTAKSVPYTLYFLLKTESFIDTLALPAK